MRCYQVRMLSDEGAEASLAEIVCADDERALARAAELAHGAPFEVWFAGALMHGPPRTWKPKRPVATRPRLS